MGRTSVWEKISPSTLLALFFSEKQGFQHLPEVLYVLGEKKFVDFLRVFAGRTIKIPDSRRLKATLRKIVCWSRIIELRAKLDLPTNRVANLVAQELGVASCDALLDYREVDLLLKELSSRLQEALANE